MNEEELNKTIVRMIREDKVLVQQINALNDYGIEFNEMTTNVYERVEDYQFYREISIQYLNPKFTKSFLNRKQISNIDFEYKDYQIVINSLESEEFTLDNKLLYDRIETMKSQMKSLNLDDDESETSPSKLLEKEQDNIDELKEQNLINTRKLKNEIEDTLNFMLQDLKRDTENLVEDIHDVIEAYNKKKGNDLTILEELKNYFSSRVKKQVAKTFTNSYKFKVNALKVKIRGCTARIISKKNSMSSKNIFDWFSIIDEIKQIKLERDITKDKYKMMKNSLPYFIEELEELISMKFDELLFYKFSVAENKKEVRISKTELYKISLHDYNNLVNKYQI